MTTPYEPAHTTSDERRQSGSGMAIASLVLGILGIPLAGLFILGLLALIFGIIALSRGTAARGMAITGLILGGIGMAISFIAIIAAIAIPSLLESRTAANEAAAASSLKSGVFPAQIAFQAGTYVDADEDGRGSYAFFGELTGEIPVRGKRLQLMSPARGGYEYIVYLPAGPRAAQPQAQPGSERPVFKDENLSETFFVAYAWPRTPDLGRRVFAITSNGTVYVTQLGERIPWQGAPPWDALLPNGWEGQPDTRLWVHYQK